MTEPTIPPQQTATPGGSQGIRMRTIGMLAVGGIAVASIIAALSFTKRGTAEAQTPYSIESDAVKMAPGTARPVRFETESAKLGQALPPTSVTGRVTTLESLTAPSFATLEGRIVQVSVHLGDRVQAGDKLVEVRTADLPGMQHDLRAAALSVQTKRAIVDRVQKLIDARAASQNDLLIAQSELAEAQLAQQAAGAKLRSLSVTQAGDNAYWVIAGRAGTIVQLEATPGKEVGPDRDKPVATVADLDEVLVLGDVAQKDAIGLTADMEASIVIPGNVAAPVMGTVQTVSEVVDPERQTVPVRVRVKNTAHTLRPNAFVDLTFPAPAGAPVVLVPSAAVVSDGSASVVFVESEPGVYKRRPVTVGRQDGHQSEIASGLKADERVVTTGALLLLNAIDLQR